LASGWRGRVGGGAIRPPPGAALSHAVHGGSRPLLPRQKPPPGYPARDLRRMVAAMVWVERTGCSWRALPDRFGPWQDVYSRYYRWRKAGLWARILQTLDGADVEVEVKCA